MKNTGSLFFSTSTVMTDIIERGIDMILDESVSTAKKHAAKKIDGLADGLVKKHKKTFGRVIYDIFIAQDFSTVADNVSTKVIVPYLKDLLVDALIFGIEESIYGSGSNGRARRRAKSQSSRYADRDRTSYSDYYESGRDSSRSSGDKRSRELKAGDMLEDVVMKDRATAEWLLDELQDFIDRFGRVTVNDLNDVLGRTGSGFNTSYFGWKSLADVKIKRVYDGYLVDFPEPVEV